MQDWNVVITVFQDGYRRAMRALRALGTVERSGYHNVLVMKAADPLELLTAVEARTAEIPALYDAISRIAPAERGFDFESAEECIERSKSVVPDWAPVLAGRSFHVRLHPRGMVHAFGTQEVERILDGAVLDATAAMGNPARVTFTDPDAVIAIDTIDGRAGLSLWMREDLARHRLLRPD